MPAPKIHILHLCIYIIIYIPICHISILPPGRILWLMHVGIIISLMESGIKRGWRENAIGMARYWPMDSMDIWKVGFRFSDARAVSLCAKGVGVHAVVHAVHLPACEVLC